MSTSAAQHLGRVVELGFPPLAHRLHVVLGDYLSYSSGRDAEVCGEVGDGRSAWPHDASVRFSISARRAKLYSATV